MVISFVDLVSWIVTIYKNILIKWGKCTHWQSISSSKNELIIELK